MNSPACSNLPLLYLSHAHRHCQIVFRCFFQKIINYHDRKRLSTVSPRVLNGAKTGYGTSQSTLCLSGVCWCGSRRDDQADAVDRLQNQLEGRPRFFGTWSDLEHETTQQSRQDNLQFEHGEFLSCTNDRRFHCNSFIGIFF